MIESNRPPAYWPSSSNDDALVVVEDARGQRSDMPQNCHQFFTGSPSLSRLVNGSGSWDEQGVANRH